MSIVYPRSLMRFIFYYAFEYTYCSSTWNRIVSDTDTMLDGLQNKTCIEGRPESLIRQSFGFFYYLYKF